MKNSFFIFTFFIFSIIVIKCKECLESDIGKYLTKCNKDNKRKIIFFWKNACTPPNNFTVFPIIENLECDLKCENGEFLTFDIDINKNKQICQKCSINTFSTGGDFRICGEKREWKEDLLKNFQNECYIVPLSDESILSNNLIQPNIYIGNSTVNSSSSSNCEAWKINNFQTNITTGSLINSYAFYVAELKYNVELKNNGSVNFGYVKYSKKDLDGTNGQFRFFIDYEEKVHDKNITSNFIDKSFNLKPGTHSFMWLFYFKSDTRDTNLEAKLNDIRMELKYITVLGIEDAAYECTSCNQNGNHGFAREGWDHCETCPQMKYLDTITNDCKDCPSDKFSYPNSIGENSCISKPMCNVFDYKEIHSECTDGKTIVSKEFETPIFCNNELNNLTLLSSKDELCNDQCQDGYFKDIDSDNKKRCFPCADGEYSNSTTNFNPYQCSKCSDGLIAPKIMNITKFHNIHTHQDKTFCKNECYSEFYSGLCDIYNHTGWKFLKDGIIPGNNLPFGIKLTMIKNINILNSNAFVEFEYEIYELKDEEYFFVQIDGKLIEGVKIDQGVHNFKNNLNLGVHELKIIYQKRRSSSGILNLNNPMIINKFILYGSDEGGAVECIKLRENENLNSDLTANEVNYLNNFIDENCPDFATINPLTRRCEINDLIHNNESNLRFIIGGLKNKINKICETESNEICYNKNKFVGPIHDNLKNDIFFISFHQNDKIHVDDFSHIKEKNFKEIGFVFGLFENNTTLHSKKNSFYREHVKNIKNLGSKISKIILNPGRPKVFKMDSGLIIKYTDGDQCIEDPNLNYTSFIFFSCEKSGFYTPPRLISKIENNCTFIFEWESRFACPSCLKKDVVGVKSGCFSNEQFIIYEENHNCIIEDGEDTKLLGYNTTCNSSINLLSYESYKKDKSAFNSYLLNKKIISDAKQFKTWLMYNSENNLTKSHNDENKLYVNSNKVKNKCNSSDDIASSDNEEDQIYSFPLFWVVLIPTFYFITTLFLIFYYCKYRRLNINYSKIKQDVNLTNNNIYNNSNTSNIHVDNYEMEDYEDVIEL